MAAARAERGELRQGNHLWPSGPLHGLGKLITRASAFSRIVR